MRKARTSPSRFSLASALLVCCLTLAGSAVIELPLLLAEDSGHFVEYDGRVPIFLAELAADEVNRREDVLKGHTLVVRAYNTRCDSALGLQELLDLFLNARSMGKPIFGFIGATCSTVSAVLAGFASAVQLPQLSYCSGKDSVPATYPYLTRMIDGGDQSVNAFVALCEHYSWKKVAIVNTDEIDEHVHDYAVLLAAGLAKVGIGYNPIAVPQNNGAAGAVAALDAIEVGDSRIVFVSHDDEEFLTAFLSEYEARGFIGQYQIIWTNGVSISLNYSAINHTLTVEDSWSYDSQPPSSKQNQFLRGTFAPQYPGWYQKRFGNSTSDQLHQATMVSPSPYPVDNVPDSCMYLAYDAVILFALALDKTILGGGDISAGASLLRSLRSVPLTDMTLDPIRIGSNGDGVTEVALMEIFWQAGTVEPFSIASRVATFFDGMLDFQRLPVLAGASFLPLPDVKAPEQPNQPSVHNISMTTAVLQWEIPDLHTAPLLSVSVELRNEGGAWWNMTNFSNSSLGAQKLALSELAAGTTYQAHVRVKTYAGMSPFSEDIRFHTDPEPNAGIDEELILIIAIVVLNFVVFLCLLYLCRGMRQRARQVYRDLKQQQTLLLERVENSCKAVVEFGFPMVVIPCSAFLRLGTLLSHETLLDKGELIFLHTFDRMVKFTEDVGKTVFMSHQWLGFTEPDPNNEQYAAMCSALRLLSKRFQLPEGLLYVWCDYFSIPQINITLKSLSINSLASYSSSATFFLIIAPHCMHTGTQKHCGRESYRRRGWCRLEQWARLAIGGSENMFLFPSEGETGIDASQMTMTPVEDISQWFYDALHVFDGDFSVDSDKFKLVNTCLGLWSRALTQQSEGVEEQDIVEYIRRNKVTIFPPQYFLQLVEVLEKQISNPESDIHKMGRQNPIARYKGNSGHLIRTCI